MINRRSIKVFRKAIAVFAFTSILSVGQLRAQDPGDTDIGDPDVPTGVPIDGGISFLLAAGAIVGARKIYKDKKGQKSGHVGY